MLRLLILIASVVISGSAATAADYAERVIIGFSADGGYFAFEEYGIQDGSGFPYSTIYVIDTANDIWVDGTPIRVVVQDESVSLETVRSDAYDLAFQALTHYGIGVPGRHLVHNPITEITDGRNVGFLIRAFTPLQSSGWTLTLNELPLPTDCPDFGSIYVGFDLWLKSPTGGVVQLNHDTSIPQSRSCPVGYGVSDVIAFDRPQDTVLLVLLNVFRLGFEGPDRRFIAIATELTQ